MAQMSFNYEYMNMTIWWYNMEVIRVQGKAAIHNAIFVFELVVVKNEHND